MSVHHVKDSDDLKTQLQEAGDKLVVLDFFATWCGPCKQISPKVDELARQEQNVVFLKVDVDECEDIATDYGVESMPTFVFIKNGKKVDTMSGANRDRLNDFIQKHK